MQTGPGCGSAPAFRHPHSSPFARTPSGCCGSTPCCRFEQWRPKGEGRFFMQVRNLSNGHGLATQLRVEPRADGMRIAYASGLKTATEFRAEPAGSDEKLATAGGAVLVVIDDYSGIPEAERQVRAGEIDKSLAWWGPRPPPVSEILDALVPLSPLALVYAPCLATHEAEGATHRVHADRNHRLRARGGSFGDPGLRVARRAVAFYAADGPVPTIRVSVTKPQTGSNRWT